MHRVKKIYDLQMNVTVSGRDGRVYITEMVDDVDQVLWLLPANSFTHLYYMCQTQGS